LKYRLMRLLRRIYPVRFEVDASRSAIFNVLKVRGDNGNKLTIGDKSLIHAYMTFEKPGAEIIIGSKTFIGASHLVCANKITIGNDVLISWGVTIVDHDSHSIEFTKRQADAVNWISGYKDWTNVQQAPIVIEDGSWIGFGAIILKGVKIGSKAVVAAGALVTRDVEPWTLVAGNPARFVKQIESKAS
jgi:acetyltransferase-like isoleucine patch superfamily enzyme